MNKLLRIVGVCLLITVLNSGVGREVMNVDSMNKLIKSSPDDSGKLRALQSLGNYYLFIEPEKSFQLSRQTLELAEKLHDSKATYVAYHDMGGYYYYRNDYKQAAQYFEKALKLAEKMGSESLIAGAYGNMALAYVKQLDYAKSLDLSEKAMALAEKNKDSVLIADIFLNRAIIYMDISDHPTALNYLMKALSLYEAKGLNNNCICYFDIGCIYLADNNYTKALEYLQLSLAKCREAKDRVDESQSLVKLGEVYAHQKDWTKALDYFQQAISLSRDVGNFEIIIAGLENIALIYNEQGKYEKAEQSLSDALAFASQINAPLAIASNYQSLAEIKMKLKEYGPAIKYLKQSLEITHASKIRSAEVAILSDLASCYGSLKDYKTQAEYLMQYNALKDSVISTEALRNSAEIEARYHLDKREKEIALLKKNKEIQAIELMKQTMLKNWFIVCTGLISILFFFIYRNYRTRQLLRMETLRAKIASDLHDDIGSTLSSISIFSQMARQESKEIIPMLDQIGEYSRKMLESMADIVWTINPENDNFEKIILRMRSFAFEMLGARNIDFDFTAEEAINDLKLKMEVRKNLFLIFKEATNNMVKYAEADQASFSVTSSKNTLTMLIRDNGKGFDLNKQVLGNGLKNMRNRAMEIGAKFLIESEPGKGTTIQLLITTA